MGVFIVTVTIKQCAHYVIILLEWIIDDQWKVSIKFCQNHGDFAGGIEMPGIVARGPYVGHS